MNYIFGPSFITSINYKHASHLCHVRLNAMLMVFAKYLEHNQRILGPAMLSSAYLRKYIKELLEHLTLPYVNKLRASS